MFTNTTDFGGNFKKQLEDQFKVSKNVTVASGYVSNDIVRYFADDFIRLASDGGVSKLLLGMAFYDGLSQTSLTTLGSLCTHLNSIKHPSGVYPSGVYVMYSRRYHGKVYHFSNDQQNSVFLGSSNFSTSGTSGNIECTVEVDNVVSQNKIINFLNYLLLPENSISILKADILATNTQSYTNRVSLTDLGKLQTYNVNSLNLLNCQSFDFRLDTVVTNEKSSLNIYFGKGRKNPNGTVTPRPWYEVELIARADITKYQ